MGNMYTYPGPDAASPTDVEEALERAQVVYFEECPIELPSEADLDLLRNLPGEMKTKNVSYHPESDSVPRFEADPEIEARVLNILRTHGKRVEELLHRIIPDFVPGWTMGTTSFRPIEEEGRDLKPRASNEIVHFDAGAYGATNGARILRFFVNVHPERDRVWGTKGGFGPVIESHPELLAAARAGKDRVPVRKGLLDHLLSGLVAGLARLYPLARTVDSSPYDRSMRRIHNYMKENDAFRADPSGYEELRFPPYTAWMVYTDGVSHSVVSGQYCFVTTLLIPLENSLRPELAPINVLASAA